MLPWLSIVRLGLVQMCLGAIIVRMTSTLNRLIVVELALPAVLPGLLVGLHYGIQITRPNWGYRSDMGGNRTVWIVGGMAVLALRAVLAAFGLMVMEWAFALGMALSVLAYALIGVGVGASGTSLLALLAAATHPRRRAAAATITWLLMIFGIAVTATVAGKYLDPCSAQRLIVVVAVVCLSAVVVTGIATSDIARGVPAAAPEVRKPFREGLAEVWAEPQARGFTLFIFLAMNAYFLQELILEPYAGLALGLTSGQTTQLSGAQNGGIFLGMLAVGIAATGLRIGTLRAGVVAGCAGSAVALVLIALLPGPALLTPAVVGPGLCNGMFAVAAIGSMMALAGQGRTGRKGTRMGLWGASQALSAGLGGLSGAAAVGLLRLALPDGPAFAAVFLAEAGLFVVAAMLAHRVLGGVTRAAKGALLPGE